MIPPEGRRVRKATSSGIDEYVYDAGGRQVADLHPGGAVTRSEVYESRVPSGAQESPSVVLWRSREEEEL